ncbi:MAG: hypothetical protein H0X39_03830 [Actinobacteria bacterium]|nr:hypothetical protein [Actinomycetota bacterium]
MTVIGLGAARASADNITWGVNDDAGKYEQGVGPFWITLQSVGMTSNTLTLRWDETSATGFDSGEADFLAPALAAAKAAGVSVTFDVYPRHSAALADPANAARFAAWVQGVAQLYPDVKEFVVMNECTQAFSSTRNTSPARTSPPPSAARSSPRATTR